MVLFCGKWTEFRCGPSQLVEPGGKVLLSYQGMTIGAASCLSILGTDSGRRPASLCLNGAVQPRCVLVQRRQRLVILSQLIMTSAALNKNTFSLQVETLLSCTLGNVLNVFNSGMEGGH